MHKKEKAVKELDVKHVEPKVDPAKCAEEAPKPVYGPNETPNVG